MLRVRLAAAAAILIPLIGLLIADFRWNFGAPGIWVAPLGLIIGLMASAEVMDLLRTPGHRPLAWTVYAAVSLIFLSACVPMARSLFAFPPPTPDLLGTLGWPFVAIAMSIALAFVGEMRRFDQPGGTVVNLALSLLTIMYVGVPMAFAALLRQLHGNQWGMAALVSVVFVVKVSDAGAYFTGKSLGRKKLAPRLSPGKTVAGAVGGMVAAVVASWVFFQWIAPAFTGGPASQQTWWGTALYGLLLGAVGLVGDLSESLIKRDVMRKDSSSWLPGLGGVLDVMDSLFFAMPAAYVCFVSGVVGP